MYDLVIKNGFVVDGSGGPRYPADVAISGGRIVRIGRINERAARVLDADGQVQDFARNALSESELAGVCFSPDGKALFINIHKDHRTYMITGPFPEVAYQGSTADDASAGCSALGSQSAVLAPLAALAFRWATQKSARGQDST